jgi:putative heme transporter
MIAAAVWSRRSFKAVLSLAITVALFIAVLPLISRAPWSAVAAALGSLTTLEIVGLTVLWLCGLYAHTFVLTAALPRLTHRRALTLSLTGSAVSNLVPLGGALGIGLNRHMTRTWGFSASAFALYTLVTNLWDVLTKLSLPAVALIALLLAGDVTRPGLQATAVVALSLLVLLVALVAVALANDRAAQWFARGLERCARAGLRTVGSRRTVAFVPAVRVLREDGIVLLTRGWTQLSLGMIAYSALQAVLLWACLHLFGSSLGPAQVFAGYAIERVLTIAVITPGGAGLVEIGITALLVAFGGAPVATVAGVLVYRAFTFGLEIPVGVVGLVLWLWHHRAGRRVGAAPVLDSGSSRTA